MLPLRPDDAGLSAPVGDGGRLRDLRQTITRMQAPAVALDAPGDIPLGVAVVDRALGGGLAHGALHEIAACGETQIAAATGFALGVAALAACAGRTPSPLEGGGDPCGALVWVAEDMALIESGVPYGPGLDLFGVAPERLLTIAGARTGDVLWAMEEALHCRAVGLVIGEVRTRAIDLVATRRLSLAAAAHGAMALLLRTAPGTEASAAATRWVVRASPSPERGGSNDRRSFGEGSFFAARPPPDRFAVDPGSSPGQALPLAGGGKGGIGPPRFALALTRNRRGPLGSWMLVWSVSDVSFVLATYPQPLARTAADRPDTRAA